MNNSTYNDENIKILNAIEAIRLRPGMYIGSTDQEGVHQLFCEILFNARDEFVIKSNTSIEVQLYEDCQTIKIKDSGRGIPIGFNQERQQYTPEILLTTLHSGGKFDKNSYNFASGLHGVGTITTSSLSSQLTLISKRDGKKYMQTFERGIPKKPTLVDCNDETGTEISFTIDELIFGENRFEVSKIKQTIQRLICLNPGLNIKFQHGTKIYEFNNGIFF